MDPEGQKKEKEVDVKNGAETTENIEKLTETQPSTPAKSTAAHETEGDTVNETATGKHSGAPEAITLEKTVENTTSKPNREPEAATTLEKTEETTTNEPNVEPGATTLEKTVETNINKPNGEPEATTTLEKTGKTTTNKHTGDPEATNSEKTVETTTKKPSVEPEAATLDKTGETTTNKRTREPEATTLKKTGEIKTDEHSRAPITTTPAKTKKNDTDRAKDNNKVTDQETIAQSKTERSSTSLGNGLNARSAKQSAYRRSPTQELENIRKSYPKPPASRQSCNSTSSLGPRLTYRKPISDGSDLSESTEKADTEVSRYSFNYLTSRLHPLGRPKLPYDSGMDGPFHRSFVNINSTLRTPKLPAYNARREVYAKEKIDRSPMVSRILTTIASYEKARDVREIRFRYRNTIRRPRSHGWPNLPTSNQQSIH